MSIDLRWFNGVLQVRQLSDRMGGPGHGPWRNVRSETAAEPAREEVVKAEQRFSAALRAHGLTLMKTAAGYEVVKLGELTAGG